MLLHQPLSKFFVAFRFFLEPLLRFAGAAKSFCFNQVLEGFLVAVMASAVACVAGNDSATMAATAMMEKLLLATCFLLRLT